MLYFYLILLWIPAFVVVDRVGIISIYAPRKPQPEIEDTLGSFGGRHRDRAIQHKLAMLRSILVHRCVALRLYLQGQLP